MLVRLLYASRAAAGTDADVVAGIVRQSKADNALAGITGVLCCCSSGVFVQVLEGGRDAVNRLYNRIVADARHGDVVLLHYGEVAERRFAGWSMAQVQLARVNPALVLKYFETATLDPHRMPGAVSLAFCEELVATAAVMGPG